MLNSMNNFTIENLSFSMEDPSWEAFKSGVDALNEKYRHWLSQNEDCVTGEAPVNLHNYYSLYQNMGVQELRVLEMQSLPIEIIEDLRKEFRLAYQ